MGGWFPALFLGWALGANDAANVFGPAVTTRAVRYRTAVLVASACVLLGAWSGGRRTLETLGDLGAQTPRSAVVVTLAAALAMTALLSLRLPASSSQAVVGAIVGAAMARDSHLDAAILGKIAQGWVLTPLVAVLIGLLGALLPPWRAARRRLGGMLHLDGAVRLALLVVGAWGAYALGANNAANVSGVYLASGLVTPTQAALLAGGSIALGIATFGWRMMDLVGRGLVRLEPPTALVVMLAQAATVHLFAVWGVPVSSSQALAGGALGLGLARGARTIGRRALVHVLLGWLVTPIAAAASAYLLAQVFLPG